MFHKVLMAISYVMLAILFIAPFLFLAGKIDLESNTLWLNIATILWFATAPIWMGKKGH